MKNIPTLIVMSKWHAAGRCKQRLAKAIGSHKAAAIQNRLTNHTITVARNVEQLGLVKVQFAISGLSTKSLQKWGDSKSLKNITNQGEGSLGLRMRRQIIKAHQKPKVSKRFSRSIIIIGSDLPTLSKLDIIQAIEALRSNEIVLGPSLDGGYWLLGLSNKLANPPATWPFASVDWGTNMVLTQTINTANKKGIKLHLLNEKNDLDNIKDLLPWQAELKTNHSLSSSLY